MQYGLEDIPQEVSVWGKPVVTPAAADFPRDVCLPVSCNRKVFLFYLHVQRQKVKHSFCAAKRG